MAWNTGDQVNKNTLNRKTKEISESVFNTRLGQDQPSLNQRTPLIHNDDTEDAQWGAVVFIDDGYIDDQLIDAIGKKPEGSYGDKDINIIMLSFAFKDENSPPAEHGLIFASTRTSNSVAAQDDRFYGPRGSFEKLLNNGPNGSYNGLPSRWRRMFTETTPSVGKLVLMSYWPQDPRNLLFQGTTRSLASNNPTWNEGPPEGESLYKDFTLNDQTGRALDGFINICDYYQGDFYILTRTSEGDEAYLNMMCRKYSSVIFEWGSSLSATDTWNPSDSSRPQSDFFINDDPPSDPLNGKFFGFDSRGKLRIIGL